MEGDKPTDCPQQGNDNAQAAAHALDDQGLPQNTDKIEEDVIGANLDETQG
ncbi:MAG TPA: hypothetical protein VGI12_10665 [Vicinamibacterales bacterium]